jgi:hypothetical protein
MRNRTIYRCKLCGGRVWIHESYESHGSHGLERIVEIHCENNCEEEENFEIEED